jgi:hypothetical protein
MARHDPGFPGISPQRNVEEKFEGGLNNGIGNGEDLEMGATEVTEVKVVLGQDPAIAKL